MVAQNFDHPAVGYIAVSPEVHGVPRCRLEQRPQAFDELPWARRAMDLGLSLTDKHYQNELAHWQGRLAELARLGELGAKRQIQPAHLPLSQVPHKIAPDARLESRQLIAVGSRNSGTG